MTSGSEREAEELLNAIVAKLKSNLPVLAKSLKHGRISWRARSDRGFEIDLEPRI